MSFFSGIKSTVKRSALAVQTYRQLDASLTALIYRLSPVLLAKLRFHHAYGRWPQLVNPKTFDEKLLWLMLYWRHPLKTTCGDKYSVRSYVTDQGFGHLLPEVHGVYESSQEINFDSLPNQFALKCSHGCKFNIICTNKAHLDVLKSRRQLDAWMKIDFSKVYGEIHYSGMKPHIICEQFLEELGHDLPSDYKLYCFDGKVHCTMACTGRTLNGKAQYDIYDRDWAAKLPYSKSSLLASRSIPCPAAYAEMVAASEILAKPFPFVRMDFYSIHGKAMLGEMTFTPSGCIDPGHTDVAQQKLSELIKLPAKLMP